MLMFSEFYIVLILRYNFLTGLYAYGLVFHFPYVGVTVFRWEPVFEVPME